MASSRSAGVIASRFFSRLRFIVMCPFVVGLNVNWVQINNDSDGTVYTQAMRLLFISGLPA